ncbi:alpha/beta hydrolase [Nonomuraea roseoviolacea]|uniref:Pimeloyl-ACP methyl ester carboxylesterase n=1 Tax=Nonomuraea roseoviolacea subsp. carminata TaxID=160689 RepID=A0ABT1JWK6_9ACTN|nr:alpha/beta hydrolase [Nonomuraea roseoviolacea]MCP2346148.1 pimeloyl-ACP methyl ester carboxylesterase [Nonomuraea roseoviolacea subsp. carminata]
MRRSLVPVLAAALLATAAPTAGRAAAAPATAARADTPAVSWAPCAEDPTAECGTLTVPVDWDHPGSGTIDLALARRKATDPEHRIGSLVVNPGGPGVSGVEYALRAGDYFGKELTGRFDVVGFDPRGVGRSHPVVCSADLLRRAPEPIMRSRADFDARLAYNQRLRQDCRARTGPLYDHVDTLSVVRDVDALRAALGEAKLTYYGVSYGTLIGQQYAERFPGNVRALAMDSSFDHSLGTAAYLDTAATHAEDSFDAFAAWCDRTTTCALHGRDVRRLWTDLLARADRGELRDPYQPDQRLSGWDVVNQAFAAFYGPYWNELAQWLVAADTGASPPARRVPAAPGEGTATRGAGEEVAPYARTVFCQDFHLPVRDYDEYAAHLRRQSAIAGDMRYSPAALYSVAACLGTPAPVPNPQHRLAVDGTPPLLLVNSLHDPATGYLWALGTARQIGREAALLTYEGAGHGVNGRGDCVTNAVTGYLVSLTVPAEGARCPALPVS